MFKVHGIGCDGGHACPCGLDDVDCPDARFAVFMAESDCSVRRVAIFDRRDEADHFAALANAIAVRRDRLAELEAADDAVFDLIDPVD